MRPLRYSINVTLDGCCDHTACTPSEQMHHHAAGLIASADALILGRVTFELMESAWRDPSPELPEWTLPFARTIDAAKKYVVSSTLERVDWNAEIARGDLRQAVLTLKEEPGDGLYVGVVTLTAALAGWGSSTSTCSWSTRTRRGEGRGCSTGFSSTWSSWIRWSSRTESSRGPTGPAT